MLLAGALGLAAACLPVADDPVLAIAPAAASELAAVGLDRAGVFARLTETARTESRGCWGVAAGNFDGQLISAGASQWNFGTGSLQPLLSAWRDRPAYRTTRRRLMPVHGRLLFSRGCRAVPVTRRCRDGIATAQDADGANGPVLTAELAALFEDDRMRQIQVDAYLALLSAAAADLRRLWPAGPYGERRLRWAIDTRIQQGGPPPDVDIRRLRARLAAMDAPERRLRLHAVVDWYGALARSADQDGIARDWAWNVAQWSCLIDAGRVDDEQAELVHISFMRGRTAIGNGGRWQALTFSRRGTIAFGTGSVDGVRTGGCPQPIAPPRVAPTTDAG